MRFSIKVQPGSKKESLERTAEGAWKLKVKTPAVDGRANARVIDILAQVLDLPKSSITLHSGQTSKTKTFEIPLDTHQIEAALKDADWK